MAIVSHLIKTRPPHEKRGKAEGTEEDKCYVASHSTNNLSFFLSFFGSSSSERHRRGIDRADRSTTMQSVLRIYIYIYIYINIYTYIHIYCITVRIRLQHAYRERGTKMNGTSARRVAHRVSTSSTKGCDRTSYLTRAPLSSLPPFLLPFPPPTDPSPPTPPHLLSSPPRLILSPVSS